MNEQELLTLARQQDIDLSTVAHEEREIRFLAGIADDPLLATHLIFKGGTALRLVYLCDRYSDDLDFDLRTRGALAKKILAALRAVAEKQELEITDSWVKLKTILLEVRAPGWKRKLKIEVSSIPRSNADAAIVRNVVSPVYPASVNVLTYPLPILLAGKMLAILERPYRTPRDLYDLFWLLSRGVEENSAYLKAAAMKEKVKKIVKDREKLYQALIEAVDDYDTTQIRSELGALLPRKQRGWAGVELQERTKELLRLRGQA